MNQFSNIVPGICSEREYMVEDHHTLERWGSDNMAVLSTAMVLGWIEEIAIGAIEPFLPRGFATVGETYNIRRLSGTAVGTQVRVLVELKKVDEDYLTFSVKAYDNQDKILEGEMVRKIVAKRAYMKEIEEKAKRC